MQPEIVDPSSEADVLLAYGRYDQAVGVLEAAVARYPDRTDLAARLFALRNRREQWLRQRITFDLVGAPTLMLVGALVSVWGTSIFALKVGGYVLMSAAVAWVFWARVKWNRLK